MEWAYGVTVVPERIENGLLRTTLESLRKAGFDNPHIFIDGIDSPPEELSSYCCTCHNPNIRTYGNWILAAWELLLRQPLADRYAIFQDDFITYPNLREYLESCPYPEKAYLNLYTFPENARSTLGWYPSNQRGRGAVALVFSREALYVLLSQRYILERPTDAKRGHKSIDGGFITAFKRVGWKEYVHNPSLVQHIGDISTMGNGRHAQANTFKGEEFDARSLIKK